MLRPSLAVVRPWQAELLVLSSVLCASAGQSTLKLALVSRSGLLHIPLLPSPAWLSSGLVLGLALYGVGTLLWVAAVSRRDLSYLYPFASLNYVLVAISARLLLHEHFGWLRWVGIFGITCGLMLLVRGETANTALEDGAA